MHGNIPKMFDKFLSSIIWIAPDGQIIYQTFSHLQQSKFAKESRFQILAKLNKVFKID